MASCLAGCLCLAAVAFAQPGTTNRSTTEDDSADTNTVESPPMPGSTPDAGDGNGAAFQALPKVMTIEKELISESEDEEFRKRKLRDYRKILRAGELRSEADRQLVREGAMWRVRRMSLKKHRDDLPRRRDDILGDILGKLPDAPNQAKELLLATVTQTARELLDGNFHVRLNAVILLGQLNQDPGNPTKGIPPTPYAPAGEVLLEVLESPDQPVAVKIQAVKGLKRMLLYGKPGKDLRLRIAQTLVAELKNRETHPWYQMTVIEALGNAGILYGRGAQGRPFVAESLAEVLIDKSRDWCVRSEAAKSLGRVPLDRSINVRLIVFEIGNLTREMIQAYNRQPNRPGWHLCFYKVYLAFKPADAEEQRRNAGLLTKLAAGVIATAHGEAVRGAYEKILPIVGHVLLQYHKRRSGENTAAKVPPQSLKGLEDWLADNKPSDYTLSPASPPLRVQPVTTGSESPRPPAG